MDFFLISHHIIVNILEWSGNEQIIFKYFISLSRDQFTSTSQFFKNQQVTNKINFFMKKVAHHAWRKLCFSRLLKLRNCEFYQKWHEKRVLKKYREMDAYFNTLIGRGHIFI